MKNVQTIARPAAAIVLNNANPTVLGHLFKNIRIAVLKTPVLDENVGVAVSIRIVTLLL